MLSVFALCWFALGCGDAGPAPQPQAESQLQRLAVLYDQYTGQHSGKAPPDADVFRKFVAKQTDADTLKSLNIKSVEELFVSPRDGQAYEFIYNVAVGAPSPKGAPVIAYEKSGAGGTRYVAYSTGQVEEVDQSRFSKLDTN